MNRTAFWICLVAFSLILGCRPVPVATHDLLVAQPATEPTLFPVTGNPRSVVYVCDGSGVMFGGDWDSVCHELAKSLAELKPTQSFSLIIFQEANSHHPDADLISFSKEPVLATAENRKKAADFLAEVQPFGGTNAIPALKAALAMHPDLLYFILYGCNYPDSAGTVELVRELNADHKTRIMTIGFNGYQEPDDDENFLNNIAKENGGTYKYVEEKDVSP